MKNTQETTQENLNLRVLIPSLTTSIYRDLMTLNTSQSIKILDFILSSYLNKVVRKKTLTLMLHKVFFFFFFFLIFI